MCIYKFSGFAHAADPFLWLVLSMSLSLSYFPHRAQVGNQRELLGCSCIRLQTHLAACYTCMYVYIYIYIYGIAFRLSPSPVTPAIGITVRDSV